MELTSAQKAQRTRAHKKAYAIMDQSVEPQQKAWEAALEIFCPIRDAQIAELQAKRDAAIAEINRQYEEDYAVEMAKFEQLMKPTHDAYDKARKEAWAVYCATMGVGN